MPASIDSASVFAPDHAAAEPRDRASALESSASPWLRFDRWLTRPRSARQVVVWFSLYLALAANWPLWKELARIGGAPSVYLPSIALMALLMVCGMVALLALSAWSRW